jgi:hypothetical protein
VQNILQQICLRHLKAWMTLQHITCACSILACTFTTYKGNICIMKDHLSRIVIPCGLRQIDSSPQPRTGLTGGPWTLDSDPKPIPIALSYPSGIILGHLQRPDVFWTQSVSVRVGRGHKNWSHVHMRISFPHRQRRIFFDRKGPAMK